jgi:hypothetical protein
MSDPPLVTLDGWRLPPSVAGLALWRVARDRTRLRRNTGVLFAKLLGTSRNRRFGPAAADLGRWAALTVWAGKPRSTVVHTAWDRLAVRHCRLTMRPLCSRGQWAGHRPFGDRTPVVHSGPILVLTRARLRPMKALRFWRALAPVAQTLDETPGLRTAFGFGEAPIGLQGTISVWARAADLTRFAYRTPEHARVVAQTPVRRWYAEELFARLAGLDVAGDPGVMDWDRVEDAG